MSGINVQELAGALQSSPVQLRGAPDPTLTASQVRSLERLIAGRDPGRIRIAVVSPLSVQATSDLTRAVADAIPADG